MIETLTTQQKVQINIYLDKWLKIGLRTEPINKTKAEQSIKFFYEEILGKKTPDKIVFLGSPMACQNAINLLKHSQLRSQLYSQLYSQIDSQLYSQLRSQIDSQLYSQIDSQLYSQIDSQLRSQLYSQLRSQIDSQLYSQIDSQKFEYFYPSWSNLFMSYYGQYEFLLTELFPEKQNDFKKYLSFLEHSKEFHQIYMFEDICFVSDFPSEIHKNERKELHNEDGPALLYRDGFSVISINGNVKKSLVEMTIDSFYNKES